MMDAAALTLLTDVRFTETARVLGLYIAAKGEGFHSISREEFQRVLGGGAGKNRIATALSTLVLYGVIEREAGGCGAHDRFRFASTVSETKTLENSVLKTETLEPATVSETKTLDAPHAGAVLTTTEFTPPPPPPELPLEPRGMSKVRLYLSDDVVDHALESGKFTGIQLVGLLGMYGPDGLEERVWTGIDKPDRQRCLRLAVLRFSNDGKQYGNQVFQQYIWRARKGEFDERSASGDGAGTDIGGADGRSAPSASQPATRGSRDPQLVNGRWVRPAA